ncbi:MAG: sulfite exporter TauE/SafE family protein [Alphaproteobacteria bacterium]|nr:sulfite exporter TauE/SafE family protein [Alphaproteobacteria bacterium]
MQIYLPIAEMPVNIFLIIGLGAAVGFLSGMFGVGGGFILTPFLMFWGIPPAVAVATQSTQIVASSVSGVLTHWRKGNVDFKMGGVLLGGGLVGSVLGIQLFNALKAAGQADLFISLSYVIFLGSIGGLMFWESLQAVRHGGSSVGSARREPGGHYWVHGWPLKMRFHRSKLYISAIPPALLGVLIGLLAVVMGIGGGFILVPAMIYLLRMPTAIVVGTSLFQIIFVAAFSTLLHAITNQSVDAILAVLLILGGVFGAQFGVRYGERLRSDWLRLCLAALVLMICLRLGVDLVLPPTDPFNLIVEGLE